MSDSKSTFKKFLGSPMRIVMAGVVCLILISGLVAVQVARADGRILPNVTIGGVHVGGLTPPEARVRLDEAMRAVNVGGVQFHHGDRSLTVRANGLSSAPPSQSPVTYDLDGMVRDAFAFGHDDGPASLITANIQAFFAGIDRPVILTVDKRALRDLMDLRFGALEKPAKDAEIVITRIEKNIATGSASSAPEVSVDWKIDVLPDATGSAFDYAAAIDRATEGLARWQGASVDVTVIVKAPDVSSVDAEAMKPRVIDVLTRGDVKLAYDDLSWTLTQKTLEKSLELGLKADGNLGILLKRDVIEPLLDVASEEIETDARPTSFTLSEDRKRVTNFVGGTVGKRVDREGTLTRVVEQFESSENGVFPIAVTTISSPDSDPVAEELGIREMLGYGTSNFAGSPTNRRKNIATGIGKLNGLVIAPGEELGLIEHLLPFDASGGWLQELVIKGTRTVPEYGGGLCQVGTTVFRSVMGAGLPVTQRQNHSFRVRYYEPAGTDATLYDPAPDFKFVNDTQQHAVLIGKVVGDIARFELWGTRDGRVQEQSKVKVLAQTPPPAAKLVETSALAEGQKTCFEKPVAGAVTSFDYTITYPDGTVKEQNFRSHYKPWQEQCLIGKAGAPHITLQKDGALKETAPKTASATATPIVQPPGFN